jgi:hypothetical protein
VHDDGGTSLRVGGLEAPALGQGNGNGGSNGHGPGRHGNESGGHGVAGMAERAAAFGGTLQAGPAPAGGWEVTTTLRDCRAPAAR